MRAWCLLVAAVGVADGSRACRLADHFEDATCDLRLDDDGRPCSGGEGDGGRWLYRGGGLCRWGGAGREGHPRGAAGEPGCRVAGDGEVGSSGAEGLRGGLHGRDEPRYACGNVCGDVFGGLVRDASVSGHGNAAIVGKGVLYSPSASGLGFTGCLNVADVTTRLASLTGGVTVAGVGRFFIGDYEALHHLPYYGFAYVFIWDGELVTPWYDDWLVRHDGACAEELGCSEYGDVDRIGIIERPWRPRSGRREPSTVTCIARSVVEGCLVRRTGSVVRNPCADAVGPPSSGSGGREGRRHGGGGGLCCWGGSGRGSRRRSPAGVPGHRVAGDGEVGGAGADGCRYRLPRSCAPRWASADVVKELQFFPLASGPVDPRCLDAADVTARLSSRRGGVTAVGVGRLFFWIQGALHHEPCEVYDVIEHRVVVASACGHRRTVCGRGVTEEDGCGGHGHLVGPYDTTSFDEGDWYVVTGWMAVLAAMFDMYAGAAKLAQWRRGSSHGGAEYSEPRDGDDSGAHRSGHIMPSAERT